MQQISDAKLNKTDLKNGNNKFYQIEAHEWNIIK